MTEQKRFKLMDWLYVVLMIVPLLTCMVIKVLTKPATEGISITGAQVYWTIPMPLMPL